MPQQDDITLDRLDRLFLVVTNCCSASCKLCSYWQTGPVKYLDLSFVREKIAPLISKYGVGVTLITGGEPTLHPKLAEIIEVIYEAGSSVTLITNGFALNSVFDRVKEYVSAYMFSLDGSTEALYRRIRGLDNFAELLAWPARIKNENPAAGVAYSCLLQKDNIADLVNLYRLIADRECDALFFNVPEMKPLCFGRGDSLNPDAAEHVLLNDREIETLERNLAHIKKMDRLNRKLLQGKKYFEDCVRYFRYLRGEEVVFRERICSVPFSSIVIDEGGGSSTCFYLPNAGALSDAAANPDDIVNHSSLVSARKDIRDNPKFREKYCRYCLQFQG